MERTSFFGLFVCHLTDSWIAQNDQDERIVMYSDVKLDPQDRIQKPKIDIGVHCQVNQRSLAALAVAAEANSLSDDNKACDSSSSRAPLSCNPYPPLAAVSSSASSPLDLLMSLACEQTYYVESEPSSTRSDTSSSADIPLEQSRPSKTRRVARHRPSTSDGGQVNDSQESPDDVMSSVPSRRPRPRRARNPSFSDDSHQQSSSRSFARAPSGLKKSSKRRRVLPPSGLVSHEFELRASPSPEHPTNTSEVSESRRRSRSQSSSPAMLQIAQAPISPPALADVSPSPVSSEDVVGPGDTGTPVGPQSDDNDSKLPRHILSAGTRTQGLTEERVKECFAMPLNEAAARLGVCASVLKRVCRRMGVKRWPSRKIIAQAKHLKRQQEATEGFEMPMPDPSLIKVKAAPRPASNIDLLGEKPQISSSTPPILFKPPSLAIADSLPPNPSSTVKGQNTNTDISPILGVSAVPSCSEPTVAPAQQSLSQVKTLPLPPPRPSIPTMTEMAISTSVNHVLKPSNMKSVGCASPFTAGASSQTSTSDSASLPKLSSEPFALPSASVSPSVSLSSSAYNRDLIIQPSSIGVLQG